MRWVIVPALLLLASPVLAFHGIGPGPGAKTYASASTAVSSSPASWDPADGTVGGTMAEQTLTLTFTGAVSVSSIALAGGSQFSNAGTGSCTATSYTNGQTCTIDLEYAYTSAVSGDDDTLTITSDADDSPETIALGPVTVSAAASYLVDEGYEGTGYEETWTEIIGSGCTADEDSAGPGTLPTGGGSQCLNITKTATIAPTYTLRSITGTNSLYARAYIYIGAEALTNNQNYDHIFAIQYNNTDGFIGVMLRKSASGQLQLQPNYQTSGGWINLTAVSVSVGQWYSVELYVNQGTDAVQWWVNGTSIDSVSGFNWMVTQQPNTIMVGYRQAAAARTGTIYYDLVRVSGSYIGP